MKDTVVNSLLSWEQAGGSRAHLEGRFQEPYHGGNPMGIVRKLWSQQ